MAGLFKTFVVRRVTITLSAPSLIFFLIIYSTVSLTSAINENTFNELLCFMGTNPLIQFIVQPVPLTGVILHFVMGLVLEIQDKRTRGSKKYYAHNGGVNFSWTSRNMVITGVMIPLLLGLHLRDFQVGKMSYKYIRFNEPNPTRYYHGLIGKFHEPLRVSMYVLCFMFLCLHLLHGFQSAFQSMDWEDNARKKLINRVGSWYPYIICGGFVFITLFHYTKFLIA